MALYHPTVNSCNTIIECGDCHHKIVSRELGLSETSKKPIKVSTEEEDYSVDQKGKHTHVCT